MWGAGCGCFRTPRPGQGEGLDTYSAFRKPWAFGWADPNDLLSRPLLLWGPCLRQHVWAQGGAGLRCPPRVFAWSSAPCRDSYGGQAVLAMPPAGVHDTPAAVRRFPGAPSAPPATGLQAQSARGTEPEGGPWVQGLVLPRQDPGASATRQALLTLRIALPCLAQPHPCTGAPSGCPACVWSWRGVRLLGGPGLRVCV